MPRKKLQIITSYPFNSEPVISNRLIPFITAANNYNYHIQIVSSDNEVYKVDGAPFEHILVPDLCRKPKNLAKRMWFEIRQARRLIKAAAAFEADYRMITVPSMFLLFQMYLFKKSIVIVDLRDITWDYVSARNPISAAIKKLFEIFAHNNLKSALFVNVTNITERNYLLDNFRLKNVELLIVPNGVTQYQYHQLSDVTVNTSTPLKIAYIGNVGLGQNLRYLVDVAINLPHVHFYIVGSGTDYTALKKYVEKAKISNLTMTGRLCWGEVKKIYISTHILYAQLSPDFSMAMPSKLYEYLSTGKFVIYGGQHQAKKTLANFDNNIVIEPCNSKSLEDAILHLLESKAYLKLSSKNQRKIEDNFIREKTVSKFFEYLNMHH
ncbi:glycosyltransferase [Amylibacter sp.]|nr:glycosyltransferase [Amylibacter sp.]